MKKLDHLSSRLLILLVVLIPILVLALLGKDLILNALILPVEYFLWLANLAVRALPQYVFWAMLCVLAACMVIYSLFSGGKETLSLEKRPPERSARERVAFWAMQLSLANSGDYSRLRFADFFSKLIVDILSYSGRISPDQYQEEMRKGSLDLPGPVLYFLKTRQTPLYALGPSSFKERLTLSWLRFISLFSRKPKEMKGAAFDQEIEDVVCYLENELEVDSHHDGY